MYMEFFGCKNIKIFLYNFDILVELDEYISKIIILIFKNKHKIENHACLNTY